ncbi:MAG: hypothetical protein N3D84_02895 [Candidatus Woesearchaeota archaeon]|nr:hypothetical protein [Candidatus Woesearchaeota archaeon]
MGWLKSIFGRKEGQEREYISIDELPEWFDEKTEPIIENIKDDLNEKFKEIRRQCDLARENSRKLENARLSNEKIPERAVSIMMGNRESYIKAVHLFLDKIKIPTSLNIGSIQHFLSEFEENLNSFTKSSAKSYYVLQEFFRNESGAIAENIRNIDVVARSLLDERYKKINEVREKIANIESFIRLRKQVLEDIKNIEANLKSLKAEYRENTDKLEKIKQTREYKEYMQIEEEKKKIKSKISKNEEDLKLLLLPLEKPLRKFAKSSSEDRIEEFTESYIHSPMDALKSDHSMRILKVLEKMKEMINADQLDLKDKKKERAIEAINAITKEKLESFKLKDKELKELMDKIRKREGINVAAQKLQEINYRISHINSQIEKHEKEIEKLKKQLEKKELQQFLKEIETEGGAALNIKLTIVAPREMLEPFAYQRKDSKEIKFKINKIKE